MIVIQLCIENSEKSATPPKERNVTFYELFIQSRLNHFRTHSNIMSVYVSGYCICPINRKFFNHILGFSIISGSIYSILFHGYVGYGRYLKKKIHANSKLSVSMQTVLSRLNSHGSPSTWPILFRGTKVCFVDWAILRWIRVYLLFFFAFCVDILSFKPSNLSIPYSIWNCL